MTNEQHPIVPTAELVEEWFANSPMDRGRTFATLAAQWGADQELDACCEWSSWRHSRHIADQLRAARRPKPPSDKELALEALQFVDEKLKGHLPLLNYCNAIHTISRALEALPND